MASLGFGADDIITALGIKGIDCSSPQFFDEEEWNSFLDKCYGIIDETLVVEAFNRGDKFIEKYDKAIDSINDQLFLYGAIEI